MATVETLRARLSAFYTAKVTSGVHSVTFQPRLSKMIEDRVVTEEWDLLGQRWIFLAICDGHGGSTTSEYTAKELPGRIRSALAVVLKNDFEDTLDRGNIGRAEPVIARTLAREVEAFDASIGNHVKEICPDPAAFSEEEARKFNEKHLNDLLLAFNGTTLAAALINVTHKFMWGIGLGDSSVVLSTTNPDGSRNVQRACIFHSMEDPEECARASSEHPSDEVVVDNGRILGWLMLPRAIGDFGLKLPAPYLGHIFKHLPFTGSMPIDPVVERIKTPPYVSSTPSVQFTDLAPLWESKPVVALFSDGVDLLVDGYVVFRQGTSSDADPCDVVAKLLQEKVDPSVEEALGHGVDLRWSGGEDNKALDVLGNLIGGTNTERLEMMLDQNLYANKELSTPFYVDDVAIIVFPLA